MLFLAIYGGANIVTTAAILMDRGVMRPSLRVWTGWLTIVLMLAAAAPIQLIIFVQNLTGRRPDDPRRAHE